MTAVDGRYAVRGDAAERPPGLHPAVDRLLGRPVTLAVLPRPATARDREAVRRWAPLSHPGLVAVLDAGAAHLVLPPGVGVLLAERASTAPVAPGQAVVWVRDLLGALVHLHAAGVVHGAVDEHAVVVGDAGAALLPVSLAPGRSRALAGPAEDVSAVLRLLALLLGDRPGDGAAGPGAQRLLEAEAATPGRLEAASALALLDAPTATAPAATAPAATAPAATAPAATAPAAPLPAPAATAAGGDSLALLEEAMRLARERTAHALPEPAPSPATAPAPPAGGRGVGSTALVPAPVPGAARGWTLRAQALAVLVLAALGILIGLLAHAVLR